MNSKTLQNEKQDNLCHLKMHLVLSVSVFLVMQTVVAVLPYIILKLWFELDWIYEVVIKNDYRHH